MLRYVDTFQSQPLGHFFKLQWLSEISLNHIEAKRFAVSFPLRRGSMIMIGTGTFCCVCEPSAVETVFLRRQEGQQIQRCHQRLQKTRRLKIDCEAVKRCEMHFFA